MNRLLSLWLQCESVYIVLNIQCGFGIHVLQTEVLSCARSKWLFGVYIVKSTGNIIMVWTSVYLRARFYKYYVKCTFQYFLSQQSTVTLVRAFMHEMATHKKQNT